MQAKSADKVKQIMSLMGVLHLRVEARERITEQGFIEKLVFWIDEEKYPSVEQVEDKAVETQQKLDREDI